MQTEPDRNPYETSTAISLEHLEAESLQEPSSFRDLIIAPRRFFLNLPAYLGARFMVPTVVVTGMAAAIDRVDTGLVRAELGSSSSSAGAMFADSWSNFWLFVILGGALGGAIRWVFLGWWYRVRLNWSGATSPDRDSARGAYVFAELIMSVPPILMAVAGTPFYANYREASDGMQWAAAALLIFIVWSVIVSYKAATTAFPGVKMNRARWWFLILPLCLYGLVLFGVMAAYMAKLS